MPFQEYKYSPEKLVEMMRHVGRMLDEVGRGKVRDGSITQQEYEEADHNRVFAEVIDYLEEAEANRKQMNPMAVMMSHILHSRIQEDFDPRKFHGFVLAYGNQMSRVSPSGHIHDAMMEEFLIHGEPQRPAEPSPPAYEDTTTSEEEPPTYTAPPKPKPSKKKKANKKAGRRRK